jgi:hypothetical protein
MKHKAGNTGYKWTEWAVYTFRKADKHARRHAVQAFQARPYGLDEFRIFAEHPEVKTLGNRVLVMQACERW